MEKKSNQELMKIHAFNCFIVSHFSLTKRLVSHHLLLCSTVTSQIAFNQQDSESHLKFELPLLPGADFQIGNLDTIPFT